MLMMGEIEQTAPAKTGLATLAGAAGHALRWALLPVGAAGLIAGAGVATGGAGGTAVMAALADPLSVMAARSPGARPAGALTQTKRHKATAPEERVLANVLTRPLDRLAPPVADGGAPGETGVVPESTVTDQGTGFPVTDTSDVNPGAPAAVGGYLVPSPGIVVSPDVTGGTGGSGGGGGGGGNTGGTTPVTTTPVTPVTPVTPSIPEPGTWLTLMLGFGAVGFALRARPRSARLRSSAARLARG